MTRRAGQGPTAERREAPNRDLVLESAKKWGSDVELDSGLERDVFFHLFSAHFPSFILTLAYPTTGASC